MAIITKPSVSRGVKATFTLNKTDLAANSIVSNDAYFSSQSTWETVSLHYKSTTRNQHVTVKFNAEVASPESTFFASAHSEGNFEINHIMINDHDGGRLTIFRSDLITANFDITFS